MIRDPSNHRGALPFKCLMARHDGFEKQFRELLNDPDSMTTHGTCYNPDEDISDGKMGVRLEYGERNPLGGMVRIDAFGDMNIRTCKVTVTDYGF